MKDKGMLDSWYKDALVKAGQDMGIKNPMIIPKVSKIVINTGFPPSGKSVTSLLDVLGSIAGQKPVKRMAKKSVAGFKIREGMIIGASVTLRGLKMRSFLSKLINLSLPRVKDFQGVGLKFDGRGNYNLGISDASVFPEADAAGIENIPFGVNVTIVTTSNKDKEAFSLLRSLGMPFLKKDKK